MFNSSQLILEGCFYVSQNLCSPKLTKFERQLGNEMMPNLARKCNYHDRHTVYQKTGER